MDEHTALFWEGAFHLRVPHIPLPLPQDDGKVMAQEPGAPIQEKALSLVPLSVPKGTALGVPLVDFKFQVPAVTASGRWAGGGLPQWPGAQPVTFSVDAQAPMVEPELTEVGELHSLTDWQVSEASEEAELDEFCRQGGTTCHQK